jgi:outer membrane protein assembly factor BamB
VTTPALRRWPAAAALLLAVAAPARADNWPQWRGPTGDGICRETRLPAEWGPTKNVAWTLPMPGRGGSTPAVWGDRIFLTSEEGEEVVFLCVSTQGKELWKRKLGAGGGGRFMRGEGDNASASPSTDGKHVYAFTGAGDFVCFDFDGKEVWTFNAQERYGRFRNQHGMHTTPLLHGDRLYLQLIHHGTKLLIALDKATGNEVWKVTRASDGYAENLDTYTSPVLWTNGSDSYLVIHGSDYTTAHSLADGSEIWRLGGLNPKERYNQALRFVATPVAVADLIVVPTAKSGPVVGVKPEAKGMITPGSPFEQWRRVRGTPDVPSPLVYDGLVYLCRETGNLTCLEAKTGAEQYADQRTHVAKHRASPVYADGKIYLTAQDGTFSVVKPGPKFELLASNTLPDQFNASPVIADGRIYLRGFKTLYAIDGGARAQK